MPSLPRQKDLHPPVQEDQRTAAEIAGALGASNAQELWEFVFSQLKRIIHGSDPGVWRDDPETVFGPNASLKALLTASGAILPDKLQSALGQYTVPPAAAAGDLVFATGNLSADVADNADASTSEVFAGIADKPTATTATLVFGGVFSGLSGLTPGSAVFAGVAGGAVHAGGLPTISGSVVKPIGFAVTPTAIILAPARSVVL